VARPWRGIGDTTVGVEGTKPEQGDWSNIQNNISVGFSGSDHSMDNDDIVILLTPSEK
jgi:hypothetical protein